MASTAEIFQRLLPRETTDEASLGARAFAFATHAQTLQRAVYATLLAHGIRFIEMEDSQSFDVMDQHTGAFPETRHCTPSTASSAPTILVRSMAVGSQFLVNARQVGGVVAGKIGARSAISENKTIRITLRLKDAKTLLSRYGNKECGRDGRDFFSDPIFEHIRVHLVHQLHPTARPIANFRSMLMVMPAFIQITKFLDTKELGRASQLSVQFSKAFGNFSIWKYMYYRDVGEPIENIPAAGSRKDWKAVYKAAFLEKSAEVVPRSRVIYNTQHSHYWSFERRGHFGRRRLYPQGPPLFGFEEENPFGLPQFPYRLESSIAPPWPLSPRFPGDMTGFPFENASQATFGQLI